MQLPVLDVCAAYDTTRQRRMVGALAVIGTPAEGRARAV